MSCNKTFKQFFHFIIWLLPVIIFLLVLFPLVCTLFMYKYFIKFLAFSFKSEYGKMLSPQSALWVNKMGQIHESTWNINVVFKIKGKLDYSKMFERVCTRLDNPELKQYCTSWLGYLFWKNDPNFRFQNHIKYVELDTFDLLESKLKTNVEIPLPLKQSPWELMFLVAKNSIEPCYYISMKCHHSLGDGHAIYSTLLKICDEPVKSLEQRSGIQKGICNSFKELFHEFLAFVDVMKNTLIAKEEPTWKLKSDYKCQKRQTIKSDTINISLIKSLAKSHNVSVFAVIIALLTGTIRRKLLKDFPTNKPKGIRCIIPINVPNHPKGLTNKIYFIDDKLPVEISEITQRLARCQEIIQREKLCKSSVFRYLVSAIMGSFPTFIPIPKPNFPPVGMSIFPGPIAPAMLDGNPVQGMSYELNGHLMQAIIFNCMSYNGNLCFLISANSEICSSAESMEEILIYLREELKLLMETEGRDSFKELNV